MPTSFVPTNPRRPDNLFDAHDFAAQHAFFTERPVLAPTPLHSHDVLARSLGIGRLVTKDETSRFGSNAFKAVGVAFATAQLRARGDIAAGEMLACASEGNHGRAVARAAREIGCRARVYMSQPGRRRPHRGHPIRGSRRRDRRRQLRRGRSRSRRRRAHPRLDGHLGHVVAGYTEIPRLHHARLHADHGRGLGSQGKFRDAARRHLRPRRCRRVAGGGRVLVGVALRPGAASGRRGRASLRGVPSGVGPERKAHGRPGAFRHRVGGPPLWRDVTYRVPSRQQPGRCVRGHRRRVRVRGHAPPRTACELATRRSAAARPGGPPWAGFSRS